jgi:hypothetical protein
MPTQRAADDETYDRARQLVAELAQAEQRLDDLRAERARLAAELHEQGMSWTEVAAALNVTRQRAFQFAREPRQAET